VTKSAEKLPGLIVVISSPSGTGPPRKKEKNGVDYYFLTDEQFNRMLKRNEFAEWANVFGYRYGTGKSELGKALKNNRVLLCDVDIQGGMSIKKKYKNAVSIFVIPPSLTELKRRLFKRRTESPSQKKLRLKTAIK
jgi:guanylate kinase